MLQRYNLIIKHINCKDNFIANVCLEVDNIVMNWNRDVL
jgi:hypothetical protein